MTIGWITDPPILLAPDERSGQAALENLKTLIETYIADTPAAPGPTGPGLLEQIQANIRHRTRRNWLQRGASAIGIVEDMIEEWRPDSEDLWVYIMCGQPLGAMTTTADDDDHFIHIDYLATHPGSADCGGVLIQKAVQLSSAKGFNGVVRLCAATDQARDVYRHLGFVDIANGGADDMELNPARSPKWHPAGNSYRYGPYVPGSRWAA